MVLRALRAKHGDSLLLLGDGVKVLIDGGPSGVYNQTLKQELEELDADGLDEPRIDLLIVSHIDADHIDGVLDLTADLTEAREDEDDPIVKIDGAWHNSFSDMIAKSGPETPNKIKASAAGLASAFDELVGPGFNPRESQLVLSSVAQGRRLRLDLKALNVRLNKGFEGRVVLQDSAERVWSRGDITLTVIGPTNVELDNLRTEWAKQVQKILAKEAAAAQASAASLDTSVSNLASIVVIAERSGKRALLTGDARGDMIMTWLEQTEYLEPGGNIHFDIVKLPHHGSDRNVSADFFDRVTADHYIVSGNGGHGNPEPAMLEMLFQARPELDFTVHMTYGPDELKANKAFKKAENPGALDKVLAAPGRREVLAFPAAGQTCIDIPF